MFIENKGQVRPLRLYLRYSRRASDVITLRNIENIIYVYLQIRVYTRNVT